MKMKGSAWTIVTSLSEMKHRMLLLALFAAPWFNGCDGGTHDDFLKADIVDYGAALEMFSKTSGSIPTTEEGLAALVRRPAGWPANRHWEQIMKQQPKDPWGSDYVYTVFSGAAVQRFSISSLGRDGVPSDDDAVQMFDIAK